MSKPSTNPPSGFRDFLPAEAAQRSALADKISAIYRAHGFQPIGMPFLESLSTLQGKGGGGENEKLIFKVMNRGEQLASSLGRSFATLVASPRFSRVDERTFSWGDEPIPTEGLADMGLRFDLTLPLARYYARFREQLPKPFKVFQIGPVWRADRPQKGRYREFYQCDVDIIGARETGAEIDCITAILEVFAAAGLDGVEAHLNDRRLLAALGRKLGVNEAAWAKCLVALDKLDKLGPDKVREEILELIRAGAPEANVSGADLDLYLLGTGGSPIEAWREVDPEAFASLEEVANGLCALQEAKVVVNPTLVRGQDYYTGTIFEIRHPSLSGSLGGGGRYNRLLEVFGSPETPAFGGSIGFERLVLLLQEKNGLAAAGAVPDLFFPLLDPALRGPVLELAAGLRARGLAVDVYPDAAKLKNQFKYADDRGIPFTAILGPAEYEAGAIKLKNMAEGSETGYATEPPEAFFEAMVKLCKRP